MKRLFKGLCLVLLGGVLIACSGSAKLKNMDDFKNIMTAEKYEVFNNDQMIYGWHTHHVNGEAADLDATIETIEAAGKEENGKSEFYEFVKYDTKEHAKEGFKYFVDFEKAVITHYDDYKVEKDTENAYFYQNNDAAWGVFITDDNYVINCNMGKGTKNTKTLQKHIKDYFELEF